MGQFLEIDVVEYRLGTRFLVFDEKILYVPLEFRRIRYLVVVVVETLSGHGEIPLIDLLIEVFHLLTYSGLEFQQRNFEGSTVQPIAGFKDNLLPFEVPWDP